MGSFRGGVFLPLAVTLAVPIAVLLLVGITLPGVDGVMFERFLSYGTRESTPGTMVGIFALELNQFVPAALLVELLALVLPSWRVLRLGGHPERDRLWLRVKIVALVMVLLQAFFFVRWLRGTAEALAPVVGLIESPQYDPFRLVTQILSLTGGAFLLLWLAGVVDNWGVGSGFSLIIVTFLVPATVQSLLSSVGHRLDAGDRVLMPLGLAAVAVAAVTRLAGGRSLRPNAASAGGEELPIPSSSVYPILASFSLFQIPTSLSAFGIDFFPDVLATETWPRRGVQAGLAAVLCVLVAWLFNRPRTVAEAWGRMGGAATDAARIENRVRGAFARSLAWSLAVCWALLGAGWICADAQLAINVVNLTAVACVVVDIVGELQFRFRHGAVADVWPVHRLYVLPGMLKALDAAGIPAFPRSRRLRTLWNFFAVVVPVEILVPVAHASRADAILRPLSGSARP